MKNFLSILLCALLLFNMLGFSVYNLTERPTNESALVGQEITLKIPVSMPYLTDWENPEEADGEIMQGADYYNVVSRQIVNDTLYVKCLSNGNARERFWNLVSTFDLQNSAGDDHQSQSGSMLLKNLVKEYMATGCKHTFFVLEWVAGKTVQPHASFASLPVSEHRVPSPPPDRA